MTIRHATIHDLPELISLLTELGYPCTIDDLTLRFERYMQNPGYGVAVCDVDNQIVGLVVWSKTDLFLLNGTRIRIEGLVVASSYRGKGIGKKLITFMEDIVKDNKQVIIDLTSGLRREKDGTHEFYKNLGYQNEGFMAKLYLRKEI